MRRCASLISICLAAFSLSALKLPADTQITGIDLARACQKDAPEDQSLCRGFIDGFTYGSQLAVGPEFIRQWRYGEQSWCFPIDANNAALRDAFLKHAQANTGTLHFPASVVLANAFALQYPCR